MSIKLKLFELNDEKEQMEKEILNFIQDKASAFQNKHNIAIDDLSVHMDSYPQTIREHLTQPKKSYVSRVNISIDEKDYILRNID